MLHAYRTCPRYISALQTRDNLYWVLYLGLSSGVSLPDPCDIHEKEWKQDETILPDISFADITFYLLETPSEFTRDKIRAYKSLEAYNFFLSGHVQDIFIYNKVTTNSSYLFIKSSVLPSQRQGQKEDLYGVWICIHVTGWILSANCTCMSGYVLIVMIHGEKSMFQDVHVKILKHAFPL